jgi:ribosome-binding protein aMBF1 (putative translation factor)
MVKRIIEDYFCDFCGKEITGNQTTIDLLSEEITFKKDRFDICESCFSDKFATILDKATERNMNQDYDYNKPDD